MAAIKAVAFVSLGGHKANERRVGAIVFIPSYQHITSFFPMSHIPDVEKANSAHLNGGSGGSSVPLGEHQGQQYYNPNLINRAITPGGHPLDTSQPAFPIYHRKLGNPAYESIHISLLPWSHSSV
ncbi:hypothetical protein [Phaffia rhodozyma]|uniref:Uncharacterized protein n=1 Tax=Phaffia rhodozyma TaxID=264483 RepID=A0A0F7ST70_PHARH|nr:hypothetical protein [Phaffia rhodozyma]